ncbi:MAG: hypothetical protein ACOVVK_24100 [Elsteraceae bacterium]
MLQDCRGLDVTSDSAAAVAAYDDAVHAFLTQSAGVEPALARALAADPDFLLAHALRGFCGRLSARRTADLMVETARAGVARSLTLRSATTRERLVAAALDHLANNQVDLALANLDAVLTAFPLDAMAVKLAHSIRFQIGRAAEMRASMEAVMPAWSDDAPGFGYMLGCRAFAHGETGDLASAERWGRAGLLRCPDDRWGAHAVAHVYEMRGEASQGVAWLDRALAADPLTDGFHRHLAWHRALALVGLSRLDQALEAFDQSVWAQPVMEYRDLANAVSLLRRVEMAGGQVGVRWESLCGAAAALLDDRRLAFSDGHALIGLIRAGKIALARRAFARIEQAARDGELSPAHYPEGSLALMRGLLDADAALLDAAMGSLDQLGGSVAQRDLFLRSAIEALIADRKHARAAELLSQRAQRFAPCRWSETAARRTLASTRSAAA